MWWRKIIPVVSLALFLLSTSMMGVVAYTDSEGSLLWEEKGNLRWDDTKEMYLLFGDVTTKSMGYHHDNMTVTNCRWEILLYDDFDAHVYYKGDKRWNIYHNATGDVIVVEDIIRDTEVLRVSTIPFTKDTVYPVDYTMVIRDDGSGWMKAFDGQGNRLAETSLSHTLSFVDGMRFDYIVDTPSPKDSYMRYMVDGDWYQPPHFTDLPDTINLEGTGTTEMMFGVDFNPNEYSGMIGFEATYDNYTINNTYDDSPHLNVTMTPEAYDSPTTVTLTFTAQQLPVDSNISLALYLYDSRGKLLDGVLGSPTEDGGYTWEEITSDEPSLLYGMSYLQAIALFVSTLVLLLVSVYHTIRFKK